MSRSIAWRTTLAMLLIPLQTVSAHITLATREAKSGAYYQAVFDVPHGCDGAPMTALTVTIPAGIVIAKPQPKPGWTLIITREKLATPVTSESGRPITQRVTTISWTGGPLPDDEFDQFVMVMRLPDTTGPLYFPTLQSCGPTETRWTEIPPAGKTPHDVRHPPPYVTLTRP
jgi:uncharacterized protein YcnI